MGIDTREVKCIVTVAEPSLEMAGSVLKLCRKACLGPEFILLFAFFPPNTVFLPLHSTVSLFHPARTSWTYLLLAICVSLNTLILGQLLRSSLTSLSDLSLPGKTVTSNF